MVAVTVYKKGAEAVKERLEADARTIEDLQRQVVELTARFREQATPSPQPSLTEGFNVQTWRPPEQLPLLAAEDMGPSPQARTALVALPLPIACRKDLANSTKIYYLVGRRYDHAQR